MPYGVPSVSAALKFKIVDTRAKFEGLSEDWRRLYASRVKSFNLFTGFDWHRAYLHHYLRSWDKDHNQLALVVGTRSGQLDFICPLIWRRQLGAKVLSFIGDPLSQYGDVIGAEDGCSTDIVHHALRFAVARLNADVVELRSVRRDGAAADALSSGRGYVLRKRKAPYIDLTHFSSLEDYQSKTQSAARRKQHRRLWRRLNEVGPAEFKVLTRGSEALQRTKEALCLKARMLSEQGIVSRAFADRRFPNFFEAIASDSGADLDFQISVLTCAENLVAAEIGFQSMGGYVSHVGVYDSAYRQFAPGRLQIERTIKSCIDRGLRRYDFLAPDSGYKRDWSTHHTDVTDYGLAYTALGHVYCRSIAFGGAFAETAKQTLPVPVMQFLAGRNNQKFSL